MRTFSRSRRAAVPLAVAVLALGGLLLDTPVEPFDPVDRALSFDEAGAATGPGDGDIDPPWDESPTIPTAVYSARSGTLAVAVEMRPPKPATGEPVRLRVTAVDDDGGVLMHAVAFRRRAHEPMPVVFSCAPPSKGTSSERPRVTASRARWVEEGTWFRSPGPHPLRVVVTSAACHRPDQRVELGVDFEVRPGAIPSNGPLPPTGAVGASPVFYGLDVTFGAGGHDDDGGYITSARLRFGDGTPAEVVRFDGRDCIDDPTSPPGSRPGSYASLTHTYPRYGSFTAEITVTSVGCDGRHPQTSTARQTFTLNEWIPDPALRPVWRP